MFEIKVLLFSLACELVHSSGIHEQQPVATLGAAPVVTAASSQYFQRTFNRLVAVPPVLEPAPVAPVFPVAPQPPVFVEATRTTVLPAAPTSPPRQEPVNPNVAIAVATAHAAAPVATILLPPYPFGLPAFGFIPPADNFPTDNPNRESTTQRPSTKTATTQREQEATTAVPSNIDNSFVQALPSNENVNFRQYLAPPLPQQVPQPAQRPQKLKTTVEVVPVPLTYIAPPPLGLHHHHHHQHHHHHHSLALKAVPHVHTFIPKTRIIIRPVSAPLRVRTIRVPAALVAYRAPQRARNAPRRIMQNQRSNSRDIEPTTFRPVNRPLNKPPRL
ncbi:unnamed protein product [Colias eurytheme]|nr:unnamed protein product [Colias eurytheme]